MSLSYDRYLDHVALGEALKALAAAHPGLVELEVIGASHEGRPIWLMTVASRGGPPPAERPALWVDGNLHAAELAGSMACLYLIEHLATRYGQDTDITRCLDTRTLYVCPRLSPDGAEAALGARPRILRAGTRAWPHADPLPGGLVPEDVDGDGRILAMRIPDPDGAWRAAPGEPRLLVARDPAESGGPYYRLLPEGLLPDYDGRLIRLGRPAQGLDFNRNFPARWRPEGEQPGAGPYPASEPEVRAAVEFLSTHPNVGAGVAFHTYSGVVLRPSSYRPDSELPPEDLWVYQRLGEEATRRTGYPVASAYHDFRSRPDEHITGALDDWLYEHHGRIGWTVELWNPQRAAGIEMRNSLDWGRAHPPEDDLKLLRWADAKLGPWGYVDWYPFEHPQLGPVELGGFQSLYTFYNPPPPLLAAEIARFPAWLVWHALTLPQLDCLRATATALGGGLYGVELVLRNTGWLPTQITAQALKVEAVRGVVVEIALPDGARLVQGMARRELGQLAGRAHLGSSVFGWAGLRADATDERAAAAWVVAGRRGQQVQLTASHPRAGVVRAALTLPA